jgi:hypothetical protein
MSHNILKIIRYLACGLLLLSLALPISQCQNKYTGLEKLFPAPVTDTPPTIYYPIDFIDFKDIGGVLMLFVFIWPVLTVLVRRRSLKPRTEMVLSVLELLMCAGSGWVIFTLGSLGRMLIGGYVGLAGVCLYLCTSVVEIRKVRKFMKAVRSSETDSRNDVSQGTH